MIFRIISNKEESTQQQGGSPKDEFLKRYMDSRPLVAASRTPSEIFKHIGFIRNTAMGMVVSDALVANTSQPGLLDV